MNQKEQQRCNEALLLALKQAGVKFVRYGGLDVANCIRAKAVPINKLLSDQSDFYAQVVIAEICFGGFTMFSDWIVGDSGITAANVLVLKPDLGSIRVLPHSPTSAFVLCNLHNQETGVPSPLCTRSLLKNTLDRAEQEFGVSFNIGAELEFCLIEIPKGTTGINPVDKCVFASMVTLNEREAVLNDIFEYLEDKLNIRIEQIHSESAPGQIEIVMKYQTDPLKLADDIIMAREIIHNCAKQHGYRALFLPKVYADQAGNGLHLHISLSDAKTKSQIPFESASGTIEEVTGSFMEGILQHLSAVMSMTMPSTNSFRRVGLGCWTGSTASWAVEDKESPLRVCRGINSRKLEHFEYKLCDSMCNIYLAMSALVWAGMDGIRQSRALRPSSTSSPIAPDLSSALEALRQNEYMMKLLGPMLSKSFLAVKQAEIKTTKILSLGEEIALVLART